MFRGITDSHSHDVIRRKSHRAKKTLTRVSDAAKRTLHVISNRAVSPQSQQFVQFIAGDPLQPWMSGLRDPRAQRQGLPVRPQGITVSIAGR